jgi:cystathionine beta-lyase
MERIAHMQGVSTTPIEATYLAWIAVDGRAGPDPVKCFEAAGVGLYDGRVFGAEGYVRLNFGCPRRLLMQGLDRMAHALRSN